MMTFEIVNCSNITAPICHCAASFGLEDQEFQILYAHVTKKKWRWF